MTIHQDLEFAVPSDASPYSQADWDRASRLVHAGATEGHPNHVGFTTIPCKDPSLKIQSIDVPGRGLMIKLVKTCTHPNATVDNLYDMLLDGTYRRSWDEHMIAGYELYRLNDNTDVGYYAMRLPIPLKNRDWAVQRSWRLGVDGTDTCMILTRSAIHPSAMEFSSFTRANCYMTVFHGRKTTNGLVLTYLTINDIKGSVPRSLYDRASRIFAPKSMETINQALINYSTWKATNDPEYKPWRRPELCELPTTADDPRIWPSPKAYIEEQKRLKKLGRTLGSSPLSSPISESMNGLDKLQIGTDGEQGRQASGGRPGSA